MKLIIAEKPSLARNIVSAIGNLSKKGSYYEGNGYIVTWAFGHLFSLKDIEDYSPNEDGSLRWTLKNIPCFPKKFEFGLKKDQNKQVDAGVKRQFETIKSLCNRSDVDTIINAGDSDREGEIIIRICVEKALNEKKNFKRLWLPDQTDETILSALGEMKDEKEYENLANEGFARTYIDWLYGVNLTRFATLKSGTLLRVGRVIVPIVKAIYDRDMAIRNFVPDIYYAIVSKTGNDGEEIELTSKNKFDKKDLQKANMLCDKYNQSVAVVTEKKKKKDSLKPGKLYSLTKLQNVLGKKYKMSMDQSLKIVQDLYEKGYVTYPRTNSEYLATAEQDKVKKIINTIKTLGYPVEFKFSKTIFDDSKIESHSALTPTFKIPKKEHLTEEEFIVYSTILRRFVAVFCAEECVVEKNEIIINVGGFEDFTLKGMVIKEKGWTKYDDYSKKDKILPELEKGDVVEINFKPVEKETTPPKHYTIETLNNYLKNPFKEEKQNAETDDDIEEYKAIFEGLELGTEATRTGIIDNAKKSGYISLKKDVYTILPQGEYLIEALMRMNISMDKYKTSELGKALKKVFRGEYTIDDSVKLAEDEIREVFTKKEVPIEKDTDDGFFGEKVGVCPLCGCDVTRTTFGYGCSGYKDGCKFSINNVILGRVISKANVMMLLKDGKTSKIEGFISKKTGKEFSAFLKLENGRAVFEF
ncbi:MAG: DNA topoisomerase III [Ruminococcaceae bacterium]|nr:DNA topoisomerase III [Oscillospiraceae bacterium]